MFKVLVDRHAQTSKLSHILMHTLIFRHTGGSLHNVWVCAGGAPRKGMEGRQTCCLLCSARPCWAGVVSHQWRGELSGRIEKLRCGSGSGELPIDMQGTVGEINPRHQLLHLQSWDCTSLHTAVSQHSVHSKDTNAVLLCNVMLD